VDFRLTAQAAYRQPAGFISGLWRDHGLALVLYALLSAGLTWPVIGHFTTRVPGNGNDVHVALWIMWHVKEAVLGWQPLFDLPLLYYPAGATLLTNALGPLVGFISLPFWHWGPQAAYNGVVLISFLLTGYFMYLLARTLGMGRSAAFFAGLYLLLAPMHVAGVSGHTTKMFLGLLPLALLTLHRALDLNQGQWRAILWSMATAFVLLLALLHTGIQFIMVAFSTLFLILVDLIQVPQGKRRLLGGRILLLALSSVLIVGPLLLRTAGAALNPALDIDRSAESLGFRPDLLEFFFPPTHSILFGEITARILPRIGIMPTIETTVSLSWVALPLVAIALLRKRKQTGVWASLAGIWLVLALGPTLQVFGRETFTHYDLPVILPYAFLTELPGLNFLRTPGRLMQMGFVATGIVAAGGLGWLLERFPRRATLLLAVASLFLLAENWPRPWPQMQLRPVPPFYRQLAADDEIYGVLDLPLTADESIPRLHYAAYYQMYQMVHRKGIAGGYIPRTYHVHPTFPCLFEAERPTPDLLVDGRPAPCPFHPAYDLPGNNYRYLVLHKPREAYSDYNEGSSPGWQEAVAFEARYLSGREPLLDDQFTRVYTMPLSPDVSALPTTLALGNNWYELEQAGDRNWRWARSPASLRFSSPRHQTVVLEITPSHLYTARDGRVLDQRGQLHVTLNNRIQTVPVAIGETAQVPLALSPGLQTVTLTLEAGNFRPAAYGESDSRWLSFAVHRLNLRQVDKTQ